MNRNTNQLCLRLRAIFVGGARFRSYGCTIVTLSLMAFNAAQAQTTNYVLGTTNLLVGPTAGSNSVVLGVTPQTGGWTATANTNWMHLSPENQAGTASAIVIFGYDANPGLTRYGTFSIGDQTLTVTQAGSTYVAAGQPTILTEWNGFEDPQGVAVDAGGNVYIANTGQGSIDEWSPSDPDTGGYVELLAIPGVGGANGVAVDAETNLYIANGNNVLKWNIANQVVTAFDPFTGSNSPNGVALDTAGNLYIADDEGNIQEWTVANSNITTLVSGLIEPFAVAVDAAGTVYIADVGATAIEEWSPASGVLTSVATGLRFPEGVAVDGSGNVYIADSGHALVKMWSPINNAVTTLAFQAPPVSSGPPIPFNPFGVALDSNGNVYVVAGPDYLDELPYAFVDIAPKVETAAAGNDSLSPVEPPTENLLPPFSPTSDQPWLKITGVTNGVVSFSVSANSGPPRVGLINLLGQAIPVTQVSLGPPIRLITVPTDGDATVKFVFGSATNLSFTVFSSTNLFLPMTTWTAIGTASNIGPTLFEFTDTNAATDSQRYYRVRYQ